jgi:hypothetical protein
MTAKARFGEGTEIETSRRKLPCQALPFKAAFAKAIVGVRPYAQKEIYYPPDLHV